MILIDHGDKVLMSFALLLLYYLIYIYIYIYIYAYIFIYTDIDIDIDMCVCFPGSVFAMDIRYITSEQWKNHK